MRYYKAIRGKVGRDEAALILKCGKGHVDALLRQGELKTGEMIGGCRYYSRKEVEALARKKMPPTDGLISRQELARRLGIRVGTVDQLRQTGKIGPSIRIQHRAYWKLSDLTEILEEYDAKRRASERGTAGKIDAYEVCEVLHCSRMTVYALTQRGELPPGEMIDRKLWWNEEDVQECRENLIRKGVCK